MFVSHAWKSAFSELVAALKTRFEAGATSGCASASGGATAVAPQATTPTCENPPQVADTAAADASCDYLWLGASTVPKHVATRGVAKAG